MEKSGLKDTDKNNAPSLANTTRKDKESCE